MSDLVREQGGWSATTLTTADTDWDSPTAGRHALDEEAVLTPIFHAMARGGWRSRQHDAAPVSRQGHADPVDEFQRDPLTAPIPVQAMTASAPVAPVTPIVRRRPGAGAHRLAETSGRHRSLEWVNHPPRR